MADYISNRIICNKNTYERIFMDYEPFKGDVVDKPYVTFNKIWNIENITDYPEYIDSSCGWEVTKLNAHSVDIRFKTRSIFPIKTIKKAISEIDNTIVWYVSEESHAFVTSFFYGKNEVCEKIYFTDYDKWDKFYEYHTGNGYSGDEESELYKNLSDADDLIWYYFDGNNIDWKQLDRVDIVKRYEGELTDVLARIMNCYNA